MEGNAVIPISIKKQCILSVTCLNFHCISYFPFLYPSRQQQVSNHNTCSLVTHLACMTPKHGIYCSDGQGDGKYEKLRDDDCSQDDECFNCTHTSVSTRCTHSDTPPYTLHDTPCTRTLVYFNNLISQFC